MKPRDMGLWMTVLRGTFGLESSRSLACSILSSWSWVVTSFKDSEGSDGGGRRDFWAVV